MGLLNKLFGGNKVKNEPDLGAVNLANELQVHLIIMI